MGVLEALVGLIGRLRQRRMKGGDAAPHDIYPTF